MCFLVSTVSIVTDPLPPNLSYINDVKGEGSPEIFSLEVGSDLHKSNKTPLNRTHFGGVKLDSNLW